MVARNDTSIDQKKKTEMIRPMSALGRIFLVAPDIFALEELSFNATRREKNSDLRWMRAISMTHWVVSYLVESVDQIRRALSIPVRCLFTTTLRARRAGHWGCRTASTSDASWLAGCGPGSRTSSAMDASSPSPVVLVNDVSCLFSGLMRWTQANEPT